MHQTALNRGKENLQARPLPKNAPANNNNNKNSFCGFTLLSSEITTKILKDTKDYQAIAAQCCKQWRSLLCSPDPPPLFGHSIVCSISVVQWARDNGCPWDEDLCSSASREGVLPVLQYL